MPYSEVGCERSARGGADESDEAAGCLSSQRGGMSELRWLEEVEWREAAAALTANDLGAGHTRVVLLASGWAC
jgi:hypothetical protein